MRSGIYARGAAAKSDFATTPHETILFFYSILYPRLFSLGNGLKYFEEMTPPQIYRLDLDAFGR